jgi:hypothetical protein
MSLSDCVKCWCNPCECGYDYRSWSTDRIKNLISTLEEMLEERKVFRKKILTDKLNKEDF